MATYAIGDVQGCFDELRRLLDIVNFDPAADQLWFVGDIVNRGSKNLDTALFIMSLHNAVVVLGNHDLHFLAVARRCQGLRKHDTLRDLLKDDRLDEIVTWLRKKPLVHHDPSTGYTMVHAGLPPMWDLETCLARASEVEAALRSDRYVRFLTQMYGNKPDRWHEDLKGADRLRLICNYFTRLRYCTADGTLELLHKTDVQPRGFEAWFRLPRPKHRNLRIVFGHWAALDGVKDRHDAIGLDTGCVWGGALTAYRLEDQRFFEATSTREREYARD